MKRVRSCKSVVHVLFVVVVSMLLTQSCDVLSQEEKSFENPYIEKTERVFSEISKSVFDNIAENIKNKTYGTITGDDILQYANEGYRKWAIKNGATETALMAGAEIVEEMHISGLQNKKSGTSLDQSQSAYLDSLLAQSELSDEQIEYILELPKVVAESGNISQLQDMLVSFDKKVHEQLGTEDSEAVLRMSALMKASMGFITANAKLLGTLAELIEESNKQQSYFYHPNLFPVEKGIFHLAQGGATDPPSWGDYFDSQDAAFVIVGGAVFGTYAGTKLGIAAGTMFPILGPWTPAAGGAIGSILGFGIGASGGYGVYKQRALLQYSEDTIEWCEDAKNYSHHDYEKTCKELNDSKL